MPMSRPARRVDHGSPLKVGNTPAALLMKPRSRADSCDGSGKRRNVGGVPCAILRLGTS